MEFYVCMKVNTIQQPNARTCESTRAFTRGKINFMRNAAEIESLQKHKTKHNISIDEFTNCTHLHSQQKQLFHN